MTDCEANLFIYNYFETKWKNLLIVIWYFAVMKYCSTLQWLSHCIRHSKVYNNSNLFNKYPTRQPDVVARSSRRLSVHPSDVAGTSQMKHPTASWWNIDKTSQWYFSTTFYWNVVTTFKKDLTTMSNQYVSTTSQTSLKWNTQRRLSGMSPRRLSGTYSWPFISTSLRRLL